MKTKAIDPFKHDSQLSERGLEALLPAKGKRKSLSSLLAQNKNKQPENGDLDTYVDIDSDKAIKWIDQFGYNKHGVCVSGKINICDISINSGQVHCEASMAFTKKGWAYGSRSGSKFTHSGAGGHHCGISLDSKMVYPTREQCAKAAQMELHDIMTGYKKYSPPAAAKVFQKAIEVLEAQMGIKSEKTGNRKDSAQIVATKSTRKNTTVQKQKSKPGPDIKPLKVKKQVNAKQTKVGDPRTEMMKFRCSHQFRLLLSEMSILTDDSIADLLHKAVQAYPKHNYKLISIDQDKLNNII